MRRADGRQQPCERCLRFEDELRDLRQRLAASGRYVAYSPGPNLNPSVEDELRRWLPTSPGACAADGFRAGWRRLEKLVAARLRDWEARVERVRRDAVGLNSYIATLVAEIERLQNASR